METVDVAAALDDTVIPSHVLQQRFLVCSLYIEHAVIKPPCCACPKLGPCHMLRCFLCTLSSVKMRGDCFVDIG
jgi:hypothetical protein